MGGYQYLITAIEDGAGILQLNHPEKRNALGWGTASRDHRRARSLGL
jgi:enoyl-CoA hydratase/carnithine racemase